MKRDFRAIVITGASSGLGAALARHHARPGVTLLLIGRDEGRLTGVAETCRAAGASVEIAAIDIRETEALAARLLAFDAVFPVDLVIANAGVEASLGPGRSAEPLDAAIEQFRVNLEGAAATVTPLLEPMRARRQGAITLISSLAAMEPMPDQPAYSASKAGLAAWGHALAGWLRPFGVTVTIACPGFIATGMTESYKGWRPFEVSAADAARRIADATARGRLVLAFPWPLVWLIRLGHLVPRILRNAVVDTLFRFTVEKGRD
ncbi:Short-chain dehydrogenase [Faunimonas pinastri]|uniref:Short-chain dehydrogenase n=1 Tax=Faunimonas pinastri TaxID=1855383 RepID=A0A1H9FGS2_9HYPH|nr:SDR family NAD(P)-dependent oxidoreductase [Faunimonas pinastri]SEQ36508.1 Short-chain dehydrogenase [Faunimonas pinastri]